MTVGYLISATLSNGEFCPLAADGEQPKLLQLVTCCYTSDAYSWSVLEGYNKPGFSVRLIETSAQPT